MYKIKENDEVIVIAGKEKGKTGKVTQIFRNRDRVLVSGVNVVKKTVKPTQENPDGGISNKEATLHISNVALISPKTKKSTRVKIETKDGKKVRVSVACGTVLD